MAQKGGGGGGAGRGRGGDEESVLVKFVTKQQQYAVSGASVLVPTSSNNAKLNEILRAYINQGSTPTNSVPRFDFVVEGRLLVGRLGEGLEESGRGLEGVAEVEYLERLPPPTPQNSLQHDDWVSTLQADSDWLLTGCYDNTVHIWSMAEIMRGREEEERDREREGDRDTPGQGGEEAGQGQAQGQVEGQGQMTGVQGPAHRLTIPAHHAPVKAVAWVNTHTDLKSFISTSIDQSAVVWVWNSVTNAVECVSECVGHIQSVECVAVDTKGEYFATGSWDTMLKIWSVANDDKKRGGGEEEEESERKRRKGKKTLKKAPLATLSGHTESISDAAWTNDAEITTCSWDHSIRVWDSEIGGVKSQIIGNCAFFSLSWSPLSRLLLAACADRHVRLYDPRLADGSVVQQRFSSHRQWVPAVSWCPVSEYLFVSGGYDNIVKIWDTRSANAPLYDLTGHEDKVLAVNWGNPGCVVTGSADCTAKAFTTTDNVKTYSGSSSGGGGV